MRYPVVWCEPGGLLHAGSLSLGPGSLSLEGGKNGERELIEIAYVDLARAGMAGRGERLGSRPTLVLDVKDGPRLLIAAAAAGAGAGVMHEVADALVRELTPA